MKVLVISPGGSVYKLIQMQAKVFDEVIILGQKRYRGKYDLIVSQLARDIPNLKIKFTSLGSYIPSCLEIIRRKKIDIIIAQDPKAAIIAYVVKKITRIPVIFQMCQDFLEYLAVQEYNPKILRPITLSINNFIIKTCCKDFFVLALSNHIKNRAIHYGATKATVIPVPGIDGSLFTKKKSNIKKGLGVEGPLILSVARPSPEKGIEYLLHALPTVVKKFPSARVLLICAGHFEDHLKKEAKKLGIENYLIFTGFVKHQELPKYYSAADVFVLPSLKEGLGYVSGEAMSCGTPVVASDTGGIPDVVIHNKTGLLVKPGNSAELSKTIIKILQNKRQTNRMIKNAKKHIKENFEEKIVEEKFNSFIQHFKYCPPS